MCWPPRAVLGVADSEFNAAELRRAGCSATVVVPVAGVRRTSPRPRSGAHRALAGATGRPRGALAVGGAVGSQQSPSRHHCRLVRGSGHDRPRRPPDSDRLADRTGLRRSPTALRRNPRTGRAVEFVEGVSDAELAAWYRCADVLVMLSDHEGFGVPLVEAMGHGTPIVAFDAGAVGEVLDGCGVLLA